MDSVQKASILANAASLAASYVSPMRRCSKYASARWQFDIPATGTPAGKWELEVSEDPRVERDVAPVYGGTPTYGTASETARWVSIGLTGDVNVHKTAASTAATVNAADITSTGATRVELVAECARPFGYMRWRYTRTSGTGTVDIFFGGRSG